MPEDIGFEYAGFNYATTVEEEEIIQIDPSAVDVADQVENLTSGFAFPEDDMDNQGLNFSSQPTVPDEAPASDFGALSFDYGSYSNFGGGYKSLASSYYKKPTVTYPEEVEEKVPSYRDHYSSISLVHEEEKPA